MLKNLAIRLTLPAALVAMLAVWPAGAPGASKAFVTAKVPPGQTTNSLLTQQFRQSVTCSKVCDATTIVSISLGDAQRLGYKGTKPANGRVTVASSYIRLKANTPTEVRFVVSPDGKKLVPKAKSGLPVKGSLVAFAKANQKVRGAVTWHTVLKPSST